MVQNQNEQLDFLFRAKWAKRQILLRRLLHQFAPPESGRKGTVPRDRTRFTPEQFTIITILESYKTGIPIIRITELMDAPYSNVTRTLDRLEKKGFIRRSRGRTDRRQTIIHLTLEGSRIAARLIDVKKKFYELVWGELSPGLKDTLIKILTS